MQVFLSSTETVLGSGEKMEELQHTAKPYLDAAAENVK